MVQPILLKIFGRQSLMKPVGILFNWEIEDTKQSSILLLPQTVLKNFIPLLIMRLGTNQIKKPLISTKNLSMPGLATLIFLSSTISRMGSRKKSINVLIQFWNLLACPHQPLFTRNFCLLHVRENMKSPYLKELKKNFSSYLKIPANYI